MMSKNYYRGEVYYADLGKISKGDKRTSEQAGIRPVIIVQNDMGNRYSPTVIVASITSQVNKAKLPTQVILDYKYIGLEKESFVMLEQVRTLDKVKLLSYVGKISAADLAKIDKAALVSLGVDDRVKIEEKVRDIEQLDNVLYVAIKTNVNEEFLDNFKRERKLSIQDLSNYCSRKGLDYTNYYKPKEQTEFKRIS